MLLGTAACGNSDASSEAVTGSNAADGSTSETAAGSIKEQIVIARPEDSNNLDPVTQDGNVNIWVLNLVMEGLMQINPETHEIEPDLAESYEVSDDYLTYTFKIKEGLTFSTGEPVLGEDFVWSYERAMNTETSSWTELCSQIESVEAPDDTTFIVHMKSPCPYAEATFSLFTLTIGDKSYFDEVGLDQYALGPVGTGPYAFSEWEQGVALTLTKNPNYRDADSVQTESIKFTVVPDDNTRIMQLENGDVDAVTFVPWSYLAELEARDDITVLNDDSTEVRAIMLNCVNGPTSDVRVRQALYMATNLDAINATVLYGHGTVADSFLNSSLPYYSSVTTVGYDIEAAKALLAEAGYADGLNLTFTIVSGNTVAEQIATMVQQQWSEIGVNLTIETYEAGTHNSMRYNLELDMFFGGWTSDILDPSQQVSYFCNPNLADCVHTGWSNDEVTALVQAAEVEMDSEARADEYAQIQQIYADEVPAIILYYAPFSTATSSKLTGFTQLPNGAYVFDNLVCTE